MVSPQVVEVMASIAASAVRPASTDGIVPGTDEVRSALTTDPGRWDQYIRNYLISDILPHWSNSSLFPLFHKAMRRPSDIAGFVKRDPIDLPQKDKRGIPISPDVKSLEYKLYANKKPGSPALDNDIVRGHSVVSDFVATGNLPPIGSQDEAVDMVTDLRAFEGLLVRIAAAEAAANQTGRPLSLVLALYRTEGDLVVPSSFSALAASLPPIEQNYEYTLADTLEPNLSKGVWLMSTKAFKRREGIRAAETIDLDYVKVRALMDWFLVIVGYDFLEQQLDQQLKRRNVDNIRKEFGRVSDLVWQSAGLPADEAAARGRFQDLLDNLDVTEVDGTNPVLKVAPVDPTKMLAMVLTEGLMFMFSGSRDIPEKLRYLHYHTQARFDARPGRVNNDQFRQILISGLSTAKKTNNPSYSALKASLVGITFPAKLKYQVIESAVISAGWATADNWELLAEFIASAGQDTWDDWFEHRANFSRYNVVLHYYESLLA